MFLLLVMQIKLNPVNGDCWNCLAHVLYKKKDYEGAQKAVEMALDNVIIWLQRKKGKNKTSLRYQSVLLRNKGNNLTVWIIIKILVKKQKCLRVC